jgi:hypothetical protein
MVGGAGVARREGAKMAGPYDPASVVRLAVVHP